MADWRDALEELAPEDRIKALLAFQLADDRVHGQSIAVAFGALCAVPRAEGLDVRKPWIAAAAQEITG